MVVEGPLPYLHIRVFFPYLVCHTCFEGCDYLGNIRVTFPLMSYDHMDMIRHDRKFIHSYSPIIGRKLHDMCLNDRPYQIQSLGITEDTFMIFRAQSQKIVITGRIIKIRQSGFLSARESVILAFIHSSFCFLHPTVREG